MTKLNSKIIEVTNRIIDRSKYYRKRYLDNVVAMENDNDNDRGSIACSNTVSYTHLTLPTNLSV